MPAKSLNALALPLVISFTFRFLFTLVDLIFVAEIKEDVPDGVAAIGLFIPIQTLFIALWVGLSAGFTATISQAFGRHDQARVAALKRSMIRINLALVPLLFALAGVVYLVAPHLNLTATLQRDFLTYALILILSMPFSGFLSLYPDSIVKAHHDTVSTMKAGILSTVANVTLNTVFVFVFHWGIAGIAMATALSRYAGFAYAALRTSALERARLAEPWDRGASAWSRSAMLDILALGVPGTLAYLLIFVEESLITTLLLLEEGSKVYLAAFAVYNRITALAIMPAIATAVAVLPFVARLVGERRHVEVRENLRSSMWLTAGLVLVIAIPAGWIFPGPLAEYLVPSATVTLGTPVAWYLGLIPVAGLAMIPFLLLRPVFEASGAPRIGVRITTLKSLAFCIPLTIAGYGTARFAEYDPLLGLLIGWIFGQLLASVTTWLTCRRLLGGDDGERSPIQT